MNLKGRLLVALAELGGAMWIAYQQMPVDQQQRVRMSVLQNGAKTLQYAARRIGEMAIECEKKYAEEING